MGNFLFCFLCGCFAKRALITLHGHLHLARYVEADSEKSRDSRFVQGIFAKHADVHSRELGLVGNVRVYQGPDPLDRQQRSG